MKFLKIALIADPELAVPPLLYGGIERIIAMLAEGYTALGHEVSLFAHKDSKTPARLFPYKGTSSRKKTDVIKNAFVINKELILGKYDIVHSFGRLLYLLPQLPLSLPKVMSYQREPTISQIKKASKLARKNTLVFTGCSSYISDQITPYATSLPIFNGINLNLYEFKEKVKTDAPLVFLGRIEPIKGTHIAIEIAKQTKKKLIIAGNIATEFQDYFDTHIQPELNDQIVYVGPVNDQQKNKFLGEALAFLMPIEWNEPFGIVMAEALACGTPVIAFNRGSVSEIVINNYNGFKCDTLDEMIERISEIHNIDRKNVRKDAETRFSSEVIVSQYLNLYHQMLVSQ